MRLGRICNGKLYEQVYVVTATVDEQTKMSGNTEQRRLFSLDISHSSMLRLEELTVENLYMWTDVTTLKEIKAKDNTPHLYTVIINRSSQPCSTCLVHCVALDNSSYCKGLCLLHVYAFSLSVC